LNHIIAKIGIHLRGVGRALGINKLIGQFVDSEKYEEKFSEAMLSQVQEGDIAWDIGANVGFYTNRLLKRVGGQGRVCAFEPSPGSVQKLMERFGEHDNINIFNYALGEEDGEINMLFDENDPTSVTNKISLDGGDKVKVMAVDSVILLQGVPTPNVVKIDVEGHELSVIKGMKKVLQNKSLRCVAIEVHFGLLSDRGEKFAPKEIEDVLLLSGFYVDWVDRSHIIALRK